MNQVSAATAPDATGSAPAAEFVAVNFIHCEADYRDRFEALFKSRAHAIDRAPGFLRMSVLAPTREGGDFLVVSFWTSGAAFEAWSRSPEFAEGHRRGFADVKAARERGETPPMTSRMETYSVLCE